MSFSLCVRKSVGLDNRGKAMANAPHSLNFKPKEQGTCGLSKKNYSRWFSSWMLLSMASSHSNQTNGENSVPVANHQSPELGFNRANRLVWVLHESARSFFRAVESLQLSGTGPALAMAWIGKDVHDWHKRIAYQVCTEVHSFIFTSNYEIHILKRSQSYYVRFIYQYHTYIVSYISLVYIYFNKGVNICVFFAFGCCPVP